MATIVVLNGPSSAGKTTLARAFQELAPTLFLNLSIDSIFAALPPSALDRVTAGLTIPGLPFIEVHDAFYACVRALADAGRDLVIDNAVTARAQADCLCAAVEGHRVLLVSVTCAPEILNQRERTRGDRHPGLASRQLDTIDRWLDYDLRIDTSERSSTESAQQIINALSADSRGALERMRQRLSLDS